MISSLLLSLALQFHGTYVAQQPTLIVAISRGNIAAARTALHQGSDPNVREILTTKPDLSKGVKGGEPYPGDTALTVAIERPSVPFVKMLLGSKADPNLRSRYGWTPLMSACSRSGSQMVKLLLSHGAKPSIKNDNGYTAMTFAIRADNAEIVEMLLSKGASVYNSEGETILIDAVRDSSWKTVKYLLKRGVNPNEHLSGKRTALEIARLGYSDDIELMLVNAGAKGRSKEVLEAQLKKEQERSYEPRTYDGPKEINVQISTDDVAVFEAVSLDLIRPDGRLKNWFRQERTKIIVLDNIGSEYSDYFDQLVNNLLDERKANDIDLQLRKDAILRNQGFKILEKIQFTDPRILIRKSSEVSDGSFRSIEFESLEKLNARFWISFDFPAYAQDSSEAFVIFSVGPTGHGSRGIAYLIKENGKWKIQWTEVVFYV